MNDLIARLGLSEQQVGAWEEFLAKDIELPQGRVSLPASGAFSSDISELFADAPWQALEAPLLQEMGFSLQVLLDHGGALLLSVGSLHGRELTLHASHEHQTEKSMWLPRGDGGVYLELAPGNSAFVGEDSRIGLLLRWHQHTLEGAYVLRKTLTVQTPESASVSLPEEVAAPVAHDPWITAQTAWRYRRGKPWPQAVAIGLFGRLRQETQAEQKEAHKLLLQGQHTTRRNAISAWVRECSVTERQSLAWLAIAELTLLEDALCELQSQASGEGKLPPLQRLAHGRDDVECLLYLFHEVDEFAGVAEYAASLDEAVKEWLQVAPQELTLQLQTDERLRRVHQLDHTAWWGLFTKESLAETKHATAGIAPVGVEDVAAPASAVSIATSDTRERPSFEALTRWLSPLTEQAIALLGIVEAYMSRANTPAVSASASTAGTSVTDEVTNKVIAITAIDGDWEGLIELYHDQEHRLAFEVRLRHSDGRPLRSATELKLFGVHKALDKGTPATILLQEVQEPQDTVSAELIVVKIDGVWRTGELSFNNK